MSRRDSLCVFQLKTDSFFIVQVSTTPKLDNNKMTLHVYTKIEIELKVTVKKERATKTEPGYDSIK